jgi:hypothetical protein
MTTAAALGDSLAGPPPDSPRTPAEALRVFYSHGSPRILTAALAVALAARFAVSGWSLWDLLPVVLLVVFWPIQEWLIHVFILHWKPRRLFGRTLDFHLPREHRAHHRDPWNYRILFIAPQAFLYSLPLLVALWFAITPTTELALTGIAGHLALALHYEWIHMLIHTRVQPRTAFYRRLWRNHRLHHFKNERYWFGVTRLEADRLLGTDPEPGTVVTSPSVRTLGLPPPGWIDETATPGA